MRQRDFIVVGQLAARVHLEDPADAASAKGGGLHRAERAHTARAVNHYASAESEQDLLVPDRQRLAEFAVNQANNVRPVDADRAQQVGLLGRGQVQSIGKDGARFLERQ